MGEQKRKARLTFFFVCGRLTTMTEEAKRGDCDDEKDESSYPGRGVVGWDGSTTSAEGEGMFSIKIAEAWGNSKRGGWRRGGLERSSASGMSDTDDETVGGEGQWTVG